MGSTFYGILVLMFYRDNRRHHLPHIHARYQGEEASFRLPWSFRAPLVIPAKAGIQNAHHAAVRFSFQPKKRVGVSMRKADRHEQSIYHENLT